MTQSSSLRDSGDVTFDDVQICATDCRPDKFDNGLAGMFDLGLVFVDNLDLSDAVVGKGFHVHCAKMCFENE